MCVDRHHFFQPHTPIKAQVKYYTIMYLIEGEDTPYCTAGQTQITIKHLMLERTQLHTVQEQ